MKKKVYGRKRESRVGSGFQEGIRYGDYIHLMEVKRDYLERKMLGYIKGVVTALELDEFLKEHERMKSVYEAAKELEKKYRYSEDPPRLEKAAKEFIRVHRELCYLIQDELTKGFEEEGR